MLTSFSKKMCLVAMLCSIALPVFAEDAPVFDVDNYPPQFDGQADKYATQSPPPSSPPMAADSANTTPPPPPPATTDAAPVVHSYNPPATASPPSSSSLTPDQRLTRVEQQINNLQHSDQMTKLETLQTELQALRGQVEQLTHQLQQLQTQQQTMYSDLDKRLNKQATVAPLPAPVDVSLKPKAAAPSKNKVKSASPVAAQPDVSSTRSTTAAPSATVAKTDASQALDQEELQIYQTAYDLIKAKKYDQAIASLQKMLQKYPSGQFAANAHYWLGELYGLQGKNDQSAVEFAKIAKDYPDSPKVSDAQLKLGMIYVAQFKWSDAKVTLKKVVTHYPGTTSARLASQQLREIKAAGH